MSPLEGLKIVTNFRKGFNRSFLVVTAIWAFYCLVVYPIQERVEATNYYEQQVRACNEIKPAYEGCLKDAQDLLRITIDEFSARNYYIGGGLKLLLAAVVGFPLVVYGVILGITAVVLWVGRGFKGG
jgi:hypothetical protein